MFFVFSKQKIYSYIVALSTVVILFVVAAVLTEQKVSTISTSAKVEKLIPIYNVNTEEKKVALTINCAWSWSQLSEI